MRDLLVFQDTITKLVKRGMFRENKNVKITKNTNAMKIKKWNNLSNINQTSTPCLQIKNITRTK